MNKITLNGTDQQGFRYGFNMNIPNLTENTVKDYIGRAVSIDASTNNGVKLAEDDEEIFGRIFTLELHMDGSQYATISTKGGVSLPVAQGVTTMTRGVAPLGAGNGFIKNGTDVSTKTCVVDISGLPNGEVIVFLS